MSIELTMFQLFCNSREHHTKNKVHVEAHREMERELKKLFSLLSHYYDTYEEAESADTQELMDFFEVSYPNSKDKDITFELMHHAFDRTVNEELIEKYLDQLREKYMAGKIIDTLTPVIEGSKYGRIDDVLSLSTEYIENMHHPVVDNSMPTPCDMSVEDVLMETVISGGLPWIIPQITEYIEGVRPKTLGLIYAFVNTGKTSFAWANVANWADALEEEECIAFCSNEESAPRHMQRGMQAFLHVTRHWLADNMTEAAEKIKATNYHKVKVFDEIRSMNQVKHILKNYRPRVMVLDQARNVEVPGSKKGEGVDGLEEKFIEYRRFANEYETGIVAINQALPRTNNQRGNIENTKWLNMSDVYGSQVAIQGALDYAIGIGRDTVDPTMENKRFIHTPKNKFGVEGKINVTFKRLTNEWYSV